MGVGHWPRAVCSLWPHEHEYISYSPLLRYVHKKSAVSCAGALGLGQGARRGATHESLCREADRRRRKRFCLREAPRRARAARRRKRRVAAVLNDLTDDQWSAIKAAWNGCAYCGKAGAALQRDCVMAISRGGRYTIDNVVPACAACNASKCNDEVTGWMRRKKLDEERFLVRQYEISRALRTGIETS